VHIGKEVWIGYDVILDTSRPHLITIKDRASLGMRVTVIAHFRETMGVTIEEDAFIGPGAIILPNVVVGHGAVVTAGSVVTKSVPPMTLVQGNPAVPIARCGVPLNSATSVKEFSRRLKPLVSETLEPQARYDVDARLVRCFSSVFPGLEHEQIHTASVESVRGWDSLAAVTLLAVVQEEFGVQIGLTDVSELVSYETIQNYIRSHNGVS
jgi:carbonic anhydrase/acetyltransferase-like protein (isoleucine patch superfamily)/acyl carrier protein